MRFTHNALMTAQLEACIEFYGRFCDMRVVKDRPGEPPLGRVVWLAPNQDESPIFVFVEHPNCPPLSEESEPLLRHFGFDLGHPGAVDAHFARFCAAGIPALPPRDWGPVAGYLFMSRDPDGRVVEFSAGQDVSPRAWDHE
jgi:catechol 2,3-dioxygenase-like lactoylglutathione lyase family enzyme